MFILSQKNMKACLFSNKVIVIKHKIKVSMKYFNKSRIYESYFPNYFVSTQDMFFGGIETTSTISEWFMTELMRHPNKMRRGEKSGGPEGNTVEVSDLDRMDFFKCAMKETLRCPSWSHVGRLSSVATEFRRGRG